jgi:hypothetical protein
MKAYKAIFRNGHFIDVETDKRLIPIQGCEYIITAKDTSFREVDSKLHKEEALNEFDKEEWALNKFGQGNFKKIYKANNKLFFRVGNAKSVEGDKGLQYIFVCQILEDLYLYCKPGSKGDSQSDWCLANCVCELMECIQGELVLSEKIRAKSLNALFNNTV